jgi:UDP-glucose 4-epimerase
MVAGKRFLVVGGAGFIGSNLTHRLHASGARVEVVDNLLTGSPGNLPEGVELHRMGAHSDGFVPMFGGDEWDAVFHLGGASSAPLFDARPQHASEAIQCFQNVLEVARQSDAPVAFASTSSFYARCQKPYREEMHVTPGTLYEFSKLSMEHLAQSYAASYGVPVTAFRFFSVYGPREQGKGRYANIVSQFLWCLRAGLAPLVYGDGSQTRDFTHVDDLLDALLLAYPQTKGFEVYNIGTGVEHTFNQVLDLLGKELKIRPNANYIANPIRNYVQETLANTDRLHALGWKAKTNLTHGIKRLAREERAPDAALVARMAEAHAPPAARAEPAH